MFDRIRLFQSLARWAGIAALLTLTVPAAAVGLNDTGITTCSNATQNGLPCPVADFPGQDAEFGSNGFDFTKLDAAGNELPADATDHTCVRDNVTRLIWQVKISDSTFTFDQTAGYVNNVNTTGLCGFNDWRMPDQKELMGIADHSIGYPRPTIDTNYFPNTPNSEFWSGSPVADLSGSAWVVSFGNGLAYYDGRNNDSHVRLVRGGQSFDSFVDNADGTVTQSNTGLMWAKCSEGQNGTNCIGDAKTMNWSAALTAANNSNLGGYDDWRLPNIKELQALVDYSRYVTAIDTDYFPNTPNGDYSWYWSGSPNNAGSAWFVHFSYGYASYLNRNEYSHVRLMRGGQSITYFSLTVKKTGTGSGSITSADNQINCGTACAADFGSGSNVILTAKPASGSAFSGWSGACSNTTGTCTVKMSDAQTVTANFNLLPSYKLSISKSGNGTITSSPAGISCGTTCSKQFSSGTIITLTAKPNTGAMFSKWTGCISLAATPLQCNITLTSSKTVTAVFGIADIKITAITLTPASPVANSTFSAKITVKNQSTMPVNGGYVDVWTNKPTVQICEAAGDKWIDVGLLAAGATKTLTVNLPTGNVGAKTLRAFVDSWCQIPESNEANNQLTKNYTVK
ncbi:DUF1566 domain-containing protein [Chromatium okenii]|uniref:Lcl domain-containing protein n=1 Tax=Chromatium okenii TaxID=61644 RepID=UPI0026E97E94|nr:DUF1566 domain-containing protein [Chromatium okenii]MBV5307888.1 DUF1566 domain-containing protein [Chromatium okenii]